MGVSVDAVTGQASCSLDWRLFVPERWDQEAMATRRAACPLPQDIHHRPKWQLVLDMLDELGGWDLWPPVLLADSGYGEVGEFRGGLDARQIGYVVEVRADTSAYPEQVHPTGALGTRIPAHAPRRASTLGLVVAFHTFPLNGGAAGHGSSFPWGAWIGCGPSPNAWF